MGPILGPFCGVQVYRCVWIHVYSYTGVQVYKYRYTGVQVHGYTSIPVYKRINTCINTRIIYGYTIIQVYSCTGNELIHV